MDYGKNGFNVNERLFLYVNGDQHFENGMLDENPQSDNEIDVQLIEYTGDDFVEGAIKQISKAYKVLTVQSIH